MDAKLDKISELSNILCEKESLGQKIVAVSHEFGLGKLMRQAHITKEQGVSQRAWHRVMRKKLGYYRKKVRKTPF